MGKYGGLTISGNTGYGFGRSITDIGDINGDGVDDIAIGTYNPTSSTYYSTSRGIYVIFGVDDGSLPINIAVNDLDGLALDGTNGFKLTLDLAGFYGSSYGAGAILAAVGDLNGDGVDDLGISGVRTYGYYGYYGDGQPAAYVLFGDATRFDAEVVIGSDIDPLDGFGVFLDGGTLTDIGAAGDVNGDGIDDLLINQRSGAYILGEPVGAYVIFGNDGTGPDALAADGPINVSDIDGDNGFGVAGSSNDYYYYGEYNFGNGRNDGVIALGDVDGDGFADLGLAIRDIFRIPAPDLDQNGDPIVDGEGNYSYNYGYYSYELDARAYVLFGEDSSVAFKSGDINGVEVFWDDLSTGGSYDNAFEFSYNTLLANGIGDINGDGYDDVAIATTNRVLLGERSPVAEDGDDARGVIGIIFGGPDGVTSTFDGSQDGLNDNVALAATFADGSPAFPPDVTIVNSDGGSFGQRGLDIRAAGDVNGDGVGDLLISTGGTFGQFENFIPGLTYVVFGRDETLGETLPPVLDLDNLSQAEIDETFYKIQLPDNNYNFGSGQRVSAAGDLNGDGFDDIMVSDPYGGGGFASAQFDSLVEISAPAQVYVIFGGADALEASDNADGANDNVINVLNLGVDVVTGALPIQVSVASSGFRQTKLEGNIDTTAYEFNVQRTGDLTEEVSFDYEIQGTGFAPADGADFDGGVLPSGSGTFAAGEATATVEILVNGDSAIEPTEDFAFVLTDASSTGTSTVTLGVTSSFGRILNDDFPASVRISGVSAEEGGDLVYTVTRSSDTTSTISVDYTIGSGFNTANAADIGAVTVDGVPIAGSFGATGTITFAPGETSKQIVVQTVDDVVIEGNEFLRVGLSNLVADGPANLDVSSATASIINNDFAPEILVTGGGSFFEGSTPGGFTPVTFDFIRRGETDGVTEITYSLNPIPAAGDFFAANGNDIDSFLPSFGNVLRFEDGESLKQVTVNIIHDGIIEPREQFEARITQVDTFNGVSYSILSSSTRVTIINDDGRPPVIPPGVEADVFGDPHIVTLDGLGYDFQAVGEYVLVESTIAADPRDFSVQVRFEPLDGSDLVSVTTRLAVNIGDVIVEIDALGANALLIDGVALTSDQIALGSIDVNGDGFPDVFFDPALSEFTVVLNDLNEQLMIKNMDGVLNACVFLSNEPGGHANNVQGLMGNANGDTTDDLTTRDGATTYVTPTFEELYGNYADSWAVTSGERNFSDTEGTGNFPAGFPVAKISIADLPDAVLAAAIAAVDAAGISDPIIRESAILDFALTGNPNFVAGASGLAADPTEAVTVTDAPVIPLSIGVTPVDATVNEADGDPNTVSFVFYRIGDPTDAVVIDYAIQGDVNAADLVAGTAFTGQVTIPAGEGSVTLDIGVLNDDLTEANERLTVRITGNDQGALVAGAKGTTTILTDDFAPDAVDDAFSTNEDTGISGNLLGANPTTVDSDANGDTLTVTGVTTSTGGSAAANGGLIILPSGAHLRVNADGTFTYNPEGFTIGSSGARDTAFDRLGTGEVATDTFSYTISDGNGGTDTATVTINVTGVNDAPVATIAQQNPTEDEIATGNVLTDPSGGGADFDPEGGALTVTKINGQLLAEIDDNAALAGAQITLAGGGILTIFADGEFSFDTNGAYEYLGDGPGQLVGVLQSVTYTIADPQGLEGSDSLRFFVEGVNDAPDAADDEADTGFETAVNILVLANDTDREGDALSVTDATSDDGTVTVAVDGLSIDFTPADGFVGEATITYTVADAIGATSQAAVTVTVAPPVNTAPDAVDDDVTVDEDVLTIVDFLANDSDAQGDPLTVTIVDGPTNGELEFSDGAWRYLSDLNFNGDDSFTYTLSDGDLTSDLATVSITVDPVNDEPVGVDDGPFAATEGATTGPLDVLANDLDVEGDTLVIIGSDAFTLLGGEVVVAADGRSLSVDYTGVDLPDLAEGETRDDDFDYAISDGDKVDAATVSLTLTGKADEAPPLNPVIGTDRTDRLVGTDGNDRIDPRDGRIDFLTGNEGDDVFDFSYSASNGLRERKFIMDFTAGEDLIDLGGASVVATSTIGTNTVLALDGDMDQIVLLGVSGFDTDYLL